MGKEILVFSGDAGTLSSVGHSLQGLNVRVKKGLASGLRSMNGAELVLIDLPEVSGALKEIKSYFPEVTAIVALENGGAEQAVEEGAYDILKKPVDPLELKTTVRNALGHISLKEKLSGIGKGGEFSELPGMRSQGMLKVFRQIQAVAAKNTPVLISGERGAGKTFLAKAIHRLGPRRAMPFIGVESPTVEELFGSAAPSKSGKIADAEGGSIFVNEAGEPLRRALAGYLGGGPSNHGDGAMKFDVRFICSSLAAEVEDAYLKCFKSHIKLPPLRDRGEDIVPLAEHFLEKAEEDFSFGKKSFSKEAVKCLLRHQWPGNVRELEGAVKKSYVLSRGSRIEKCHLGLDEGSIYGSVKEFLDDKLGKYIRQMKDMRDSSLYDTVLSEVEKAIIELALRETGGNQVKAAAALGMNRNTLRAKIKSYKIRLR